MQAVSPKNNLEFSLHQPAANDSGNRDEESQSIDFSDNMPESKQALKQEELPEDAQEVEHKSIIGDNKDADTQSGEINSENKTATKVLQGQINYTVPCGTPIKLKLAAVPSHPMKIMDRDLDGNLYPARLGQKITARTSEDIYVDHNKIIPEGSILCGEVTKILPPRRVGRPGSLALSFNQLITPDGRKFAFKAEANNAKASTVRTKAKGFGIIAAHAAGGAIVGALVAYEIFGLEKTIAMHGYNIAGGAAGGALLATGFAIMRKGPKATLEPGDDLNIVIDSDLLMPIAIEVDPKNKRPEITDLKMEIEKSKIVSDGVGGHFVTIETTIVNDSDDDLSSIDLFLEDTNGDRHPVCSSPDEDSQFLFHIEPHSKQHLHLSFLTPYPKLKQQLVWVDHHTKLALARQKIQ